MKEWLISITATCLLLVLMELMLSDGKTKKYISGILRLTIIIALLSPIAGIFKKDLDWQFPKDEEIINQSSFDTLNELVKTYTESSLEQELNAQGGICQVNIELRDNEIDKVSVNVKLNGINSDGENIYTNEKIVECIKKTINIAEERIYIYGTN